MAAGQRPSAGIALYAGLFTPHVERLELYQPTTSHRDGPYFLNVLRILDMPQAVALAFPSQVSLYDTDRTVWQWSESVAKLYDADKPPLQVRSLPAGE